MLRTDVKSHIFCVRADPTLHDLPPTFLARRSVRFGIIHLETDMSAARKGGRKENSVRIAADGDSRDMKINKDCRNVHSPTSRSSFQEDIRILIIADQLSTTRSSLASLPVPFRLICTHMCTYIHI